MDGSRLCFLLAYLSVWSTTHADVSSLPRRRRSLLAVESLRIRLDRVEVDLHREQQTNAFLKTELAQLKSAYAAPTVTPDGRKSEGDLPDAVWKRLADATRNACRTDLEAVQSGLAAEKARMLRVAEAVEFCKDALRTHGSRLRSVDAALTHLAEGVTGLNATVVEAASNFSRCAAEPSRPPTDPASQKTPDKCPEFRTEVIGDGSDGPLLGAAACHRRYKYASLLFVGQTVDFLVVSSGGPSQDTRSVVRVRLSNECPGTSMKRGEMYLLFTDDPMPQAQSYRAYVTLEDALILSPVVSDTIEKSGAYRGKTAYMKTVIHHLRQGNWIKLCGVSR